MTWPNMAEWKHHTVISAAHWNEKVSLTGMRMGRGTRGHAHSAETDSVWTCVTAGSASRNKTTQVNDSTIMVIYWYQSVSHILVLLAADFCCCCNLLSIITDHKNSPNTTVTTLYDYTLSTKTHIQHQQQLKYCLNLISVFFNHCVVRDSQVCHGELSTSLN